MSMNLPEQGAIRVTRVDIPSGPFVGRNRLEDGGERYSADWSDSLAFRTSFPPTEVKSISFSPFTGTGWPTFF